MRFHELSGHVRSISWSEEEQEQLQSFDEWSLLRYSQSMGDLLPNLRSLYVSCATASGARVLVPWISSSLTSVEICITVTEDDNAWNSILSALEECCTNLTSLFLTINHQGLRKQPMMHQALLSMLQNMRGLRVVTIPLYAYPGPHIDALGAMPDLEELTIHLMEPPRGCDSFDKAAHFAESSVFPNAAQDDYLDSLDEFDELLYFPQVSSYVQQDCLLDPLDELCDLLALTQTSPLSTVYAVTQPFPRLHTLHLAGQFTYIADILTSNITQLKRLNLTVPSVRSENDMAEVMEIIGNTHSRLDLVTVHIVLCTNLQWIDARPLGQVPHAILVGHTMFHSVGLTPAMEEAERAVSRRYSLR